MRLPLAKLDTRRPDIEARPVRGAQQPTSRALPPPGRPRAPRQAPVSPKRAGLRLPLAFLCGIALAAVRAAVCGVVTVGPEQPPHRAVAREASRVHQRVLRQVLRASPA